MTQSSEKRHKPETLRAMLAVGCHRLDVGRAREVAALIQTHPGKTRQLVECLFDSDPGIANRAADALERASYPQPSLLAPWKDLVLGLLPDAKQNNLRWNLALIVPRMQLTKPEIARAAAVLNTYLDDPGSLVKTAAMHGLAGLAQQDATLMPQVLDLLRVLSRSGTPAMRARGRILLGKLRSRFE
jgi:hypothetical protein